MKDATVTIGPTKIKVWPTFLNHLKEYAEAYKTLTSKKGRQYIRDHLDEICNYLEHLIKHEEKPK